MRGDGKSIRECREHLAKHGIKRTPAAVGRLFHDRAVLGELHFGDLENLNAHDAIITPEEFRRAQKASAPRGRHPKSDRLLARLGVLRCESCGSRLVVGQSNNGTTPTYRCRNLDCERGVVDQREDRREGRHRSRQGADRRRGGPGTAEALAMNAIADRDAAQAKLDAAIATLAEVMDEPVSIETIGKLRAARDAAQEEVDQLGGEAVVERVRGAGDWDRLTLSEKRDLIRIHAPRVTVAPAAARPRHDRAARPVGGRPPGRGRAGSRRGRVAARRSYERHQRLGLWLRLLIDDHRDGHRQRDQASIFCPSLPRGFAKRHFGPTHFAEALRTCRVRSSWSGWRILCGGDRLGQPLRCQAHRAGFLRVGEHLPRSGSRARAAGRAARRRPRDRGRRRSPGQRSANC